ncbi:MAG: nucleotidyltransferase domain-containing protein [Candidatus Pacebacteria bacterium]|nr:nucleotidyltransferase domain-containing protein [Candidatus Paceibacterota bacterium]MDD5012858.1 nucleotidyltransferase domain-containing protein [Candidatus Paceibacterota bacterium]MDD5752789.1 nucleotidyltransferase domain-containing protein [Candidatus Paceibacterota bacterium]
MKIMTSFKSKITVKILGYFFLNEDRKHYINEFAQILDEDAGNLFRKLKELEKEGILSSEKIGQEKYFFLNKKYVLLKELKSMYENKYGLAEKIKERLLNLKGLESVYIFGSYAKNKSGKESTFNSESDIDLLLIGSHNSLIAKKAILPLEKVMGRDINIIDFSSSDFEKKRKEKDDFIENIFKEGVIKII